MPRGRVSHSVPIPLARDLLGREVAAFEVVRGRHGDFSRDFEHLTAHLRDRPHFACDTHADALVDHPRRAVPQERGEEAACP